MRPRGRKDVRRLAQSPSCSSTGRMSPGPHMLKPCGSEAIFIIPSRVESPFFPVGDQGVESHKSSTQLARLPLEACAWLSHRGREAVSLLTERRERRGGGGGRRRRAALLSSFLLLLSSFLPGRRRRRLRGANYTTRPRKESQMGETGERRRGKKEGGCGKGNTAQRRQHLQGKLGSELLSCLHKMQNVTLSFFQLARFDPVSCAARSS